MTTGRINQVTVLRARRSRARQRVQRGSLPPSPARVSHRPIKSRPSVAVAARHPALSGDPSHSSANGAPSPPISHAPGAVPPVQQTRVDPFGGDYRRAAAPVERGLPERGGSPICWSQTELANIGNRVHTPLHRPQKRQRRSARHTLPGSSGVLQHRTKARPWFSIPSGYILQGRRINRSDPGRPAVPSKAASHWAPWTGRRRRSLRRCYPGGPSTSPHSAPAPIRHPPSPRQPHFTHQDGAITGHPPTDSASDASSSGSPSRFPSQRPPPLPLPYRKARRGGPGRHQPKRLELTVFGLGLDTLGQECFAPCECSPSM